MTNKIKLREKDIFPIAQGMPTHWSLCIFDKGNSRDSCEKLKQQILEWQEKAEKYDDLMQANNEVVQQNISLTQTHQENKKLKNELEFWHNKAYEEQVKYDELKEKLERICKENIELRELNNGLDYECENYVNENRKLKEKAEKWDNCLELGRNKRPEEYLAIGAKCLERELEKDTEVRKLRQENKQLKERLDSENINLHKATLTELKQLLSEAEK